MKESLPDIDSPTVFTSIEERLAAIWRSTLQLKDIEVDDNFIALGGNSMTMMIVLFRVREEFGVNLNQELIFQAPTLREFGAIVAMASSCSALPAEDGVIE